MNLRILLLGAAALLMLVAARPVAPEDLYKMTFVSAPQLSPDGKLVVFTASRMNGPKDTYDSNLYLVATAGGAPRRIGKTGDSGTVWSPDSRTIVFSRSPKKGEHGQLFAYYVATSAVKQLTHVKTGAGGAVFSHDGKMIAFSSTTVVPAHDAYVNFGAAGFKPKADQKKTDVHIVHDLFFEGNGAGYTYNRFPHIWVVNADGSGTRALTSGTQWGEGNPQWSPDDKTIAFDSLRRTTVYSGPNDVYTIPARGGTMRKLQSSAPSTFTVSFDRAGNLWTFRFDYKDPAAQPAVVVSSANGADARTLIPANLKDFGDTVLADMGEPGGLCGPFFAPHDAFALLDENLPGFSALVKLDPKTGALTQITNRGEAAECSMDAAGTSVAYTLSDFTHPRDVYLTDLQTGKTTQLTHMNDAYLSQVLLSQPQEFTVKDDAGFPVQAWFMPAVGPKAHGKRPTMLNIHGGPQTQFGNTFFHELQYWAGQGYNVVFSDPRGSVGHGYPFEAALSQNWGDAMFDDVQRIMDETIKRPQVDPSRLVVSGGSYGGYATLWIIAHTNRYKVAIAERPVSNLTSEQLVADFASKNGFGDFTTYGFGKPWDPKSLNYTESPLTYVEDVHTPVMILHADEDTRAPIDQALQEFSALKILGRPVEYVAFPGENHDLSRTGSPIHRMERLHIETDYVAHYVRP